MKFTYDPSLYELADGRAFATFVSVSPFDKRQLKFDAFPNSGPLVRWVFKIISGENAGKEAAVLTGANPSPRSAAARMIYGLTGISPDEGVEVDVDNAIGGYYAISIVDGKLSHQYPPQRFGHDYTKARNTWVAMYPDDEEPPNKTEADKPAF